MKKNSFDMRLHKLKDLQPWYKITLISLPVPSPYASYVEKIES